MNKKYIVIVFILVVGSVNYIFLNNKKTQSVYLKINCSEDNISSMYKEGDIFKCNLLGNNFEIKIEDINDEKIKLKSSNYGLFPIREDGSISIIDKVNNFGLYKGKKWF